MSMSQITEDISVALLVISAALNTTSTTLHGALYANHHYHLRMDPCHRKIDLQSPSDLKYLLKNIKAAAKEKIDLAMPISAAPEGEDTYKSKVEELVQEYIFQTLNFALPNLTLNGLDPSPTLLQPDPAPNSDASIEVESYESYDPRLAERLRTLYAEFEVQSTRVAELRREAPGAAARRYMERLEEELRRERQMETMRELEGTLEVNPLKTCPLERKQDVENIWKGGRLGLVDLGKAPSVLAKLERAGKAVEAVEGI